MKFLISLVLVTVSSFAHAAPTPILERTSTESYSGGRSRVAKCSISVDGVAITRSFDGITSTEEKNFKLSGNVDAKIDDAIATKAEEKKGTPTTDLSYSYVAYKGGSTIVLSSYDAPTGAESFNPASGAGVLREIMQNICGK